MTMESELLENDLIRLADGLHKIIACARDVGAADLAHQMDPVKFPKTEIKDAELMLRETVRSFTREYLQRETSNFVKYLREQQET